MDNASAQESSPEAAGMNGNGAVQHKEGVPPSPPASPKAIYGAMLPPPPQTQPSTPTAPVEHQFVIDDDDDDDSIIVEDAFVDEPADEPATTKKAPKKGRRVRSKAAQKLKAHSSTSNQKSYWSSDDDSSFGAAAAAAAARPSKRHEAASAKTPPPTDSAKKARSKRRLRQVQEDKGESSSSSSDEEARMQQQQRMVPPTLTPTKDNPPPVAVIRTKKAKSPHMSPKQAKRSSVAVNLNGSSSSNLNFNNGSSSSSNLNNNSSNNVAAPSPKGTPRTTPEGLRLSIEDMEIMQRLDDEYENALEEREVGYMARYASVRQSAFLSVVFMLIFLALGTTFFMRYADWSIHDSLLFSIYTITTVGYGNQAIPKETGFQCFTILYIFVGIATLTMMVAQIYQCIALEASRAQHSRDKTEMARRGLDIMPRRGDQQSPQNRSVQSSQASANSSVSVEAPGMNIFMDELAFMDTFMQYYERAKHFFKYNEYGRSFSVLLPFAGLILAGAIVVGPLEGWNVIESIYFSVVSLTTVGFGDYYPRHVGSVWFCILWLPFSVGFMSLFLKNVATFYIKLSAKNVNRIERRMRRRLARAKERFEHEQAEAMKRAYHGQAGAAELELRQFPSASDSDDEGQGSSTKKTTSQGRPGTRGRRRGRNKQFDALPTTPEDSSVATTPVSASRASLFGSPGEEADAMNRREQIIKNSLGVNQDDYRPKGQTMDTMKRVLEAVHKSIASGDNDSRYMSMTSSVMKLPVGNTGNAPMRKPSFALRAMIQERFAEILATDIAGFQSSIEIKDNTLSVTIDSLKATADKWCIPRRARKAFRAVAFEALYFVGEHGLITRGADALYALTPFEFHGLFSPLLAAMGDADTMEAWLASTEVLAEVDLRHKDADDASEPGDVETGKRSVRTTSEKLHTATHRIKTQDSSSLDQMISPGTAFS